MKTEQWIEKVLNNIEEVPLPENFHEEVMKKMKKEKQDYRRYLNAAAAAVVCFIVMTAVLTSMNPNNNTSNESDMGAVNDKVMYSGLKEESAVEDEGSEPIILSDAVQNQAAQGVTNFALEVASERKIAGGADPKIIYSYSIELEVEDFDNTIRKLMEISNNIDSSEIYTTGDGRKVCHMTQRVSADYFNEATDSVLAMGIVINASEWARDVTSEYIDTEIRLASKKREEERLFELLNKVEKIQEMVFIENRLSEIRYETERSRTLLNGFNRDTGTCVINISLKSEVAAVEETEALTEKMKSAFLRSLDFTTRCFEWALVTLSSVFSWIVIIGIVLFFVLRRRIKG